MRKINLEVWNAKDSKGKDIEEDLLVALGVLIANKKPEEMPRGLDKFRTFSRLSKAFENAEKSRVLELEEFDYKFLKDEIENSIPSSWGMNKDISKAIEDFLDAKEEK